jgi:hypothetical protein
MGWWPRRMSAAAASGLQRREEISRVRDDLLAFTSTRSGVEAFVEPATTMTPATVLLVASTGEWTRRPIIEPALVRELAQRHAVPVYDVQLVGYPQRMRDWNDRAKRRRNEAGS